MWWLQIDAILPQENTDDCATATFFREFGVLWKCTLCVHSRYCSSSYYFLCSWVGIRVLAQWEEGTFRLRVNSCTEWWKRNLKDFSYTDDWQHGYKVLHETHVNNFGLEMNSMPTSMSASIDGSNSIDKQYPQNGGAGEHVYDLDFMELNGLRPVSVYNIHIYHDSPIYNNSSYDPIRKLRILPAPPPLRFIRNSSSRSFRKSCQQPQA